MDFKNKYLKYKKKYLNLKLELEGGKKNIVRKDLVYIYHRFKNDEINETDESGPLEYENCREHPTFPNSGRQICEKTYFPPGMKKFKYTNNLIKDSAVKLIHGRGHDGYYQDIKAFLEDFVNANFEYLEMKYGGRFEKNGIFKKGKHLDKKGKYMKHKSGMIGHYHGYFDELLKTWEEEMKGKKPLPTPILLEDNQTIYDNTDFYRDTFLLGVTPFNGYYYGHMLSSGYQAKPDNPRTQEEARMIMIKQIIKRLQLDVKPKNTDEWLEFLKSQKTSKGTTYQPNIDYITDSAKAVESFKQETKDFVREYEYDVKFYRQFQNKGYEAYSDAFATAMVR